MWLYSAFLDCNCDKYCEDDDDDDDDNDNDDDGVFDDDDADAMPLTNSNKDLYEITMSSDNHYSVTSEEICFHFNSWSLKVMTLFQPRTLSWSFDILYIQLFPIIIF